MKRLAAVSVALVVASIAVAAGTRLLRAQTVAPENAITTGELVVDPPTLINLGFEWVVEGDANHTATVAVSYRKTGDAAWRAALPLLRLDGERVKSGRQIDVIVPN